MRVECGTAYLLAVPPCCPFHCLQASSATFCRPVSPGCLSPKRRPSRIVHHCMPDKLATAGWEQILSCAILVETMATQSLSEFNGKELWDFA